MDQLSGGGSLGLPVFLPLYNRSGLNAGIESGGVIRPGDAIELLD